MQRTFREIAPETIKDNPFKLIGSEWMLVTAGTLGSFNTMTASWGGLGHLWDRNVCFTFVRPTRYTYEFMEKSKEFTLSFFDEKFREALTFCGSQSGRDVNKVAKTGLTPIETGLKSVSFLEARMILECRKIYFQDINPKHFLEPAIADFYGAKDYHRLYIGEVVKAWAKS
jgi:flavin reductase (DIM6/NTAB) family NADH-FMN oxidoreductase RutF